MIGLDTNILARSIVRDDDIQARKTDALFTEIQQQAIQGYVSILVLCELLWLLSSRYGYGKPSLIAVLEMLVYNEDIMMEEEALITSALSSYQQSNVNFADILIGLKHKQAGCQTTITFDKQAATLDAFTLLA